MFPVRFVDKQIVRLQETPDEIPEGETPHTVSLLMHDKLADAAKPGDRVEVCMIIEIEEDYLIWLCNAFFKRFLYALRLQVYSEQPQFNWAQHTGH